MKLDYKKTFILGLGFFAISLTWPLYNYYIPLFLKTYIKSQFWINSIMTLDNILAITLIPVFGSLSDRTNTRFGRRMPYLLIGIPISAILFALLPQYSSFTSLMIILISFNLAMAIYRAPTVALMPDITPRPLRSKANGIINFMGGLASVLVLSVGAVLYDINKNLPFIATAILMFLALAMLYIFIKEPKNITVTTNEEQKIGLISSIKEIFVSKDKTALYILLAIFFWFVGYQGVEATFSNYSVHFLKIKESTGSIILSSFAAAFLVFAIPSGFIATKFGKKRTILVGVAGLFIVFGLLAIVRTTTSVFGMPYNVVMMLLFAIGGFFWACININSYPMVVETTTEEKVGTYTGIYYFFSSLAAILGPLIFGFFVDFLGFGSMFITAAVSFAIAFIFVFMIKSDTKTNRS
ncbi:MULTISPECIES: MFS transporter [Kosmotoga]|uniref:Major facilitator superfamily MFS_1 n=1 Tax=Kosmotoga olearia (strain ATCC BAA-1733 / DSM 21960 / TBF 19.5.1) TaxID=521045 RepID=C5CHJ2_KOSOT|nr:MULTISPECIES: MFS transporter [Kosmotoga]ACR79747.1 major facilitator superfamily MFS_1 [Kosmotoga olearia TBF 19.5.1]